MTRYLGAWVVSLAVLLGISGCGDRAASLSAVDPHLEASRPQDSSESQALSLAPTVADVVQLLREGELAVPASITISPPIQSIVVSPAKTGVIDLESMLETSPPRLLYAVYGVVGPATRSDGVPNTTFMYDIVRDERDSLRALRLASYGGASQWEGIDAMLDLVPPVAPSERRAIIVGRYFRLVVKWDGSERCGVFTPRDRDDPFNAVPPPPSDSKLPIDKPLYGAELDEWFAKEFK